MVPWGYAGLRRGPADSLTAHAAERSAWSAEERNASLRNNAGPDADARGPMSLHLDNDGVAAQTQHEPLPLCDQTHDHPFRFFSHRSPLLAVPPGRSHSGPEHTRPGSR